MPRRHGNVLNWATELDPAALEQAQRAASMPFVEGHVALMPDAHVGLGATVGSVIPTRGAVIPSAVGVDIGCGMIAVECPFNESHELVYQRILEQNASVGEYYEMTCPEFLESMPPETRAHLYNTTMRGPRDIAADRVFVPPGK